MNQHAGQEHRWRQRARRVTPAVVTALVLTASLAAAWRFGWPAAAAITIESRLPSTVLVDLRSASSPMRVDGPVAQRLEPGSSVVFPVTAGAQVCIRLITVADRRVRSLRISALDRGTRMTIDVDRESLGRMKEQASVAGATGCEPRLAGDRVRLTVTRSFEPARPHVIRNETLLKRY